MKPTIVSNANRSIGPEFHIRCSCGSKAITIAQTPKVLYGSLRADINTVFSCGDCGASVTLDKGERA